MRTDRDLQYFANPDGPHTTQLIDILVTFALAEPSVPYTQGMTDLLSPILVVMQDEVDASLQFLVSDYSSCPRRRWRLQCSGTA